MALATSGSSTSGETDPSPSIVDVQRVREADGPRGVAQVDSVVTIRDCPVLVARVPGCQGMVGSCFDA